MVHNIVSVIPLKRDEATKILVFLKLGEHLENNKLSYFICKFFKTYK